MPPAALGSGPYLGRGRAGRKLEKIDFSDFFFPTFRKGDCRGKVNIFKGKIPKNYPPKNCDAATARDPMPWCRSRSRYWGARVAHVTGVHGLFTLLGCPKCSRYCGVPALHSAPSSAGVHCSSDQPTVHASAGSLGSRHLVSRDRCSR